MAPNDIQLKEKSDIRSYNTTETVKWITAVVVTKKSFLHSKCQIASYLVLLCRHNWIPDTQEGEFSVISMLLA